MPEQSYYSVTLLEKRQLTADVFEFRFEKPADFAFEPGQYVQFRIPTGDSFVLRSYSIASGASDPYLEFVIKLQENGKASGFFSALKPQEKAEFSQARGLFKIENPQGKYVFVATGTGIAPIMSMIRSNVAKTVPVTLALNQSGGSTTVVKEKAIAVVPFEFDLTFGVRYKEDVFWSEELQKLREAFPNFSYRITVSRPDNWSGLSGRVTDHLVPADTEASYFVCGGLEMVKDVRSILFSAGLSADQVHFEIF